MKKLCALALSAVIGVASIATFSACEMIDNLFNTSTYSETFVGSASKETYTTEQNAVKAYLSEEISGNSAQAEFVSYESQGELTSAEQKSLALSDDEKAGLSSVEIIVVTYREKSTLSTAGATYTQGVQEKSLSSSTPADTDEETYTQTIYILKYESGAFRYFVPAPSNGDVLTKSYFDSVLDPDKYLNVTFNFKSAYESTYVSGSTTSTSTRDWDAVAKVAGYYLYETDTIKETSSEITTEYTTILYGLVQNGYMHQAYYSNGTWKTGKASSGNYFGSAYSNITDDEFIYKVVENVLINWFGASIDYTYFEKTDTGFALRANKMKEYLATQGELSSSELDNLEKFNAEYTIFVTDGRINQCTSKISYETSTRTYAASYTISPTDFGKTEITVPDNIQAKLG